MPIDEECQVFFEFFNRVGLTSYFYGLSQLLSGRAINLALL